MYPPTWRECFFYQPSVGTSEDVRTIEYGIYHNRGGTRGLYRILNTGSMRFLDHCWQANSATRRDVKCCNYYRPAIDIMSIIESVQTVPTTTKLDACHE